LQPRLTPDKLTARQGQEPLAGMMINQQVTFIYTTDVATSSAFLRDVIGLKMVLNQDDNCHIYQVTDSSFLGVCCNRPVPEDPGVTYTFVVSDVDQTYAQWQARGVVFEALPALSTRFNVYAAFFRDPAGYRFEIQEFRDPSWPRPTPIP
jgi:predicted enzyme related to lactoylglutathione lyase